MTAAAVRIEVCDITPDKKLEKWTRAANDFLGVPLQRLEEVKVYKIAPAAQLANAQEALGGVFADPVLQSVYYSPAKATAAEKPAYVAEISYRPGVTDNSARAAEEALALTGVDAAVASGSLYFLYGALDEAAAQKIAQELLANALIQKIDIRSYDDFLAHDRFGAVTLPRAVFSHPVAVENVSLELDDTALEKLSKDRFLALTVEELHHIRDYYRRPEIQAARKAQGLPPAMPTDVEIEVFAQTWSEHCKHKIFAAKIDYTGPDGQTQVIDSLYKTYIKKATADVKAARGLDWLVSVFSDNAGIVRFDDNVDLCIKVETHNSPSALDPYGGALTGILGVNRDILGCGLGARPIANTDVFCFAPPDMPTADEAPFMPVGPKSPRRILEGVHKGVEDGGNKSGIPTVNGAFFFDRDYAGKPLVFVGTVGVMPPVLPDGRPSAEKKLFAGDRIVVIGGAVGADGIHGATFSSLELNDNAPATAVQIGDPLTQKRVMDFLMEARDEGLFSAITDNGAGGLSSSIGEMAQMSGGATLDLALCPVKYPGLSPWELMVSESQERMSLAVPPAKLAAFMYLAKHRGVSACDLGAFDDSGALTVLYKGKLVGQLDLHFLHNSLPQMQLKAHFTGPKQRAPWSATTEVRESRKPAPKTAGAALLALLSSPNITSKEKWVRAYDHEVQAATHLKPFGGAASDGPSDAGVVWLQPHGGQAENGVAIGCGMAPRLSPVAPLRMAQCAVDEAVRNVVAAGGDPDTLCLLDNFCWPDPVESAKTPDGAYKLGQLVRSCMGLYEICTAYGAPLVSGKDSMKNDFRGKDARGHDISISVLPTLMITAMAKVQMGSVAGSAFRAAGDMIYLLGTGMAQGLAGSEYAALYKVDEDLGPSITLAKNIALYRQLHQAMKAGLVQSAHDVSEGGLLVALAESMAAGRLGAAVDISSAPDVLFNEAPGRFVISVSPAHQSSFEEMMAGSAVSLLGQVTADDKLTLNAQEEIALADIVAAWKKGF